MITSNIFKLPPEHKAALNLLFPRKFGSLAHINLDALLQSEGPKNTTYHDNPQIKQKIIDLFHAQYSIGGSYGGWMEDRTNMWKGSYLDKDAKFVHLGIDCNLPAKTAVAFPIPAQVIYTRTDPSTEIGWGTYMCLQTKKNVYVLGHLSQDIKVKVGEKTDFQHLIGSIGTYPQNGNVFEHLHIQVMSIETYAQLKTDIETKLDGYGCCSQIDDLKLKYPDPLVTICDELGGVDEIHPKFAIVTREQWKKYYS